jgi:hypothetical protein
MTLNEKLAQFKDTVSAQLSAADIALMEEGTIALSRSGIAARTKKVGEAAPPFVLPNSRGELISLTDLRKQGPVVVTFYRGVW